MLSSDLLQSSFQEFLNKEDAYKLQFTQNNYSFGFDGYSFLGQPDSTNQYPDDPLHSFVLSTETPIELFPKEFHEFLSRGFPEILKTISHLEGGWITEHFSKTEHHIYQEQMGHMISCNYYPAGSKTHSLLSTHKDVSFITTFPFGNPPGLHTQKDQTFCSFDDTEHIFGFPGFFAEKITLGTQEATAHKVETMDNKQDRFSFAFFSLPKSGATGSWGNTNSYFSEYLNLF